MPKILKQKNNKRANISDNNFNNVLTNIKPNFPPILTTNDLIKNALKSDTSNRSKAKTLPNAFIAYRMALIKEYRNNNIKLPPMGQLSRIAKNSWDKESQNVKDLYNKLAEDTKSLYKQRTIQIVLDNHMNQGGQVSPLRSTSVIPDYENSTQDLENPTVSIINSFQDNNASFASINYDSPTQNINDLENPTVSSINSFQDHNARFPNISSYNNSTQDSYIIELEQIIYDSLGINSLIHFIQLRNLNSTPDYREHIRLLEQTINYLFRKNLQK